MKEELADIKRAITLLQKAVASLEGRLPVETEKKQNGFKPPRHDWASAWYKDRGYHFNFATWWNHYTSNGWKVGKNPMKDWHASMAQWESKWLQDHPRIARSEAAYDASGRPISGNGTGRLL